MPTPLIAIRMPRELVERLREEAGRESEKRGDPVSWVWVLRRAAEHYLAEAASRRG
jgi:hypothetical protein